MTPERRPSEAASSRSTPEFGESAEKGGRFMEVKKNTEAPQLHVNWVHLFLVLFHVSTIVLSLATHKLWTVETVSRALP
jgi:hypothetical protein